MLDACDPDKMDYIYYILLLLFIILVYCYFYCNIFGRNLLCKEKT